MMRKETKLKIFIVVLICLAWLLYLVTLMINDGRSHYDISSRLDKYIPFLPIFIIPYIIWWPLVWLPVIVTIRDNKLLTKVASAFIFLIVVSNILFLVFPTKMERQVLNQDNIFEKLVGIFYSLDYPYNLFPSLHISSTILSFLIMLKLKKDWAYKLSIAYISVLPAPLFIKQHYLLDVFGGLVVGAITFYLFFVKNRFSQRLADFDSKPI